MAERRSLSIVFVYFLADLAGRLMDERRWQVAEVVLTGCEFHQHGDEKPCYRTKTLGGVV